MNQLRPLLAAALLAVVPCAARAAVVSYAAPAANLPTGHVRGATFDAVLPSGRVVTPVGTSVLTGMNALGFALSPDGRYAIVSDDDAQGAEVHARTDPSASGGYGLAVVDLGTMRVVDRYVAQQGEAFWLGVAALRDPVDPQRTLVLASGGPSNAVYAFTLDGSGRLTPDAKHVIAVPGDPGTIAVSRDGRHAYVVEQVGDAVATIDAATRTLAGTPQAVGYFPFGAALDGNRIVVTNEGLMRYAALAQPQAAPLFGTPAADLTHASALSLLGIASDGTLAGASASVPMDPAPDGFRNVGGAHPNAVVTTANGTYAYVAMANVDRVASVALGGTPRVVGGTELRLFDRGPYGTQPAALALSHDGSRLYVALAGLDAVAVIDARDPAHLHRLGLIPTGWYPTALALSTDDRTLYVLNTKGFGHEEAAATNASAVWSTLQKVDLAAVRLNDATMTTLKNTRRVVTAPVRYPAQVKNVVVILQPGKTFDAMLGDLGPPLGAPSWSTSAASAAPNLHALARTFALAGNFYTDAASASAAHQIASGGIATLYTARTAATNERRFGFADANEDPEDAARFGSLFNALARHRLSYRDYGELLAVAGAQGTSYTTNVPAEAVLADHVDPNYPAPGALVSATQRAEEFVRDYGALARSGRAPRYASVWLPATSDAVADGDRALGTIVDALSHLSSWRNTAIFVMPDDTGTSIDHVDPYRAYALVISPYAKHRYVGMRHLSTASVVKTTEQILHLGSLSLGDLLATDMSDFFTPRPTLAPYTALAPPVQGARSP